MARETTAFFTGSVGTVDFSSPVTVVKHISTKLWYFNRGTCKRLRDFMLHQKLFWNLNQCCSKEKKLKSQASIKPQIKFKINPTVRIIILKKYIYIFYNMI